MNEIIFYIVGYLAVALCATYLVFVKTKSASLKNKHLVRSGVLALFFGPAILWRFPFAFPVPAIVAMVSSIEAMFSYEVINLILGAVAFAFIPFFIFWGLYYGIASVYFHLSNTRHNKPLNEDAP